VAELTGVPGRPDALGCSVADLTGQPYLAVDRQSAVVTAAVAEIGTALHDVTLDDVPDALVEACKVAYILAKRTGRIELAGIAAQRGLDAAGLVERPDLVALMEMNRISTLIGVGAHRRDRLVCAEALREISALPGLTKDDTTTAEACGMLHLTTALIAARDGRIGDVATHLAQARSLAAYTGERTHMRYHFGPTTVAAWELGLVVVAGTGPVVAERLAAAPIDLSVFASKGRAAYVHVDLARAWAQADGAHDGEAVRAGYRRPPGAGSPP
jgi:hypothetical protein